MASRADIQNLCDVIVADSAPQRVILFGSHAYGSPSADSDVDLLVVLPFDGSPIRKAAEISQHIPHRFPVDVLARTPEEVARRLKLGDPFFREIVERGIVLYDAADAGVGTKS